MHVTVLNGKESVSVEIPAPTTSSGAWLQALQDQVAILCGVEIAHQKLLFRGKQLTIAHGSQLKDGSKLMLLKNASFHKSGAATAKTASSSPPPSSSAAAVETADHPPQKTVVSQRIEIDPSDIDDAHVLLQAMRGKSVYEFLCATDATIAAVKSRVGAALGLSGNAIRLILKGKTPPDDAVLSRFVASTTSIRVLKCMVLLNAQQHDLMDREDELRSIQNELTSVETQFHKLSRVMVRNILPREEVLLQLHVLRDRVAQLTSNLEIVQNQIKATKLSSGTATQAALANATQVCEQLREQVESLMARFESGR